MAENEGLCRFARGYTVGDKVIRCDSAEVVRLVGNITWAENNEETNGVVYTNSVQELRERCCAICPCSERNEKGKTLSKREVYEDKLKKAKMGALVGR